MNDKKQNATPADGAPLALEGLLLDFKNLLPGDILLVRDLDQKKLQREISAATESPYTHAAIYLGDNEIAEAMPLPSGVRERQLSDADKSGRVIGVLRSQMAFLNDRPKKLSKFVRTVVQAARGYDWRGVYNFEEVRSGFLLTVLDELRKNYGKVSPEAELVRRRYFCSAFIVVCYFVAGVIDDSAQIAYEPNAFSPADLYGDPAFGWLLGYITDDSNNIGHDDPLLGLMQWRNDQAGQWWR